MQSSSYVVYDDKTFDGSTGQWMCYLCDFSSGRPVFNPKIDKFKQDKDIRMHLVPMPEFDIIPRDSYRQRIFIEPLCLYIVLDTGRISMVSISFQSRKLYIVFDQEEKRTFDYFRVRLEKTCTLNVRPGFDFFPTGQSESDRVRGAYILPAHSVQHVEVSWQN